MALCFPAAAMLLLMPLLSASLRQTSPADVAPLGQAKACCAQGWRVTRTSDVVADLTDAQVFRGLGREVVLFACGVHKNGRCLKHPTEIMNRESSLQEYMLMYPGSDRKMHAEWKGAGEQRKTIGDVFSHVRRLNPKRAEAMEAFVRAIPGQISFAEVEDVGTILTKMQEAQPEGLSPEQAEDRKAAIKGAGFLFGALSKSWDSLVANGVAQSVATKPVPAAAKPVQTASGTRATGRVALPT